jgi:hypothetical protein
MLAGCRRLLAATFACCVSATLAQATWAQSSNTQIAKDTVAGYRAIKAGLYEAFQGIPPNGLKRQIASTELFLGKDSGGSVSLMGILCNYAELFGTPRDAPPAKRTALRLKNLASAAITYEYDLPRRGFEVSVVREEVAKLEAESLRTINARLHWLDGNSDMFEDMHDPAPQIAPVRQFADTLMRAHAGKRVPRLVASGGGCGAGEMEVRLRSDPPGGQIYIIEAFNYRICEKLEPGLGEHLQRCDGWQSVSDATYPVAGLYRYKIGWPGRPISKSQALSFYKVNEGAVIRLRGGTE